jgi:hypothetical protein
MGRSQVTKRYEITPEIKELQELASKLTPMGHSINISISEDLVIFNGHRRMNRKDAKDHLIKMIEESKISKGIREFPDKEEEARKERLAAKVRKKNRTPGEPPELEALIRRAKRIYKKSIIKGLMSTDSSLKAQDYIRRKGTDETKGPAEQALLDYIAKEKANV